jgi:D-alanyl-D-alanine-carboxypeptidase/D-alanyl-D-alanine-endopeptidase
VLGVTVGGETAIVSFGKISDASDEAPGGDTLIRIGSVSKVFTGTALASLVADGTVALSDPIAKYLPPGTVVPTAGGNAIRLIDIATHTSGLPREVDYPPGADGAPYTNRNEATTTAAIAENPPLFPPGTGALYSNFAFDLLGVALGHAAGKPYPDVLAERVLAPAGLVDTLVALRPGDDARLMVGHDFDGHEIPDVPSPAVMAGAGSLYSTPNDILKWLDWHMQRFAVEDAEVRILDHAAYVFRDELRPVLGLDESGHMDAMALGWVVMTAESSRPLILQKAGGYAGTFVYAAFSPEKRVGAFVAINKYDFATGMEMAHVVNDLIADLAPR